MRVAEEYDQEVEIAQGCLPLLGFLLGFGVALGGAAWVSSHLVPPSWVALVGAKNLNVLLTSCLGAPLLYAFKWGLPQAELLSCQVTPEPPGSVPDPPSGVVWVELNLKVKPRGSWDPEAVKAFVRGGYTSGGERSVFLQVEPGAFEGTEFPVRLFVGFPEGPNRLQVMYGSRPLLKTLVVD